MAQRVRLHRPALHQALVGVPTQFVALARKLRLRAMGAVAATLDDEHVDPGRGEVARDEPRGQSAPDDHDGAPFQCLDHGLPENQLKSTMDFGAAAPGYGLPRYWTMSSVCV